MNIVVDFSKKDWLKQWSGHWSILTCTYLSYQYTRGLKGVFGRNIRYSLIIQKKGYSAGYYEQEDYKKFGLFLASQIKTDKQVRYWSSELIAKSKNIRELMWKFRRTASQQKNHEQFMIAFNEYGVAHRMVKLAVDFLPKKVLAKNLKNLQRARLYSETVYEEIENHMRIFAKEVFKETKIAPELVLACTKDEIEKFWLSNKLPSIKLLKQRYAACALVYTDKSAEIVTGRKLLIIEKGMNRLILSAKSVQGKMGYKGKVTGVARIIFEPKKQTIKSGEILITGMTRPDYIPLIKKSSAFVTDAGGVLSHAAITARELKKPCVVGTKIATKIFKDGDMIEVDATKGIVRKI